MTTRTTREKNRALVARLTEEKKRFSGCKSEVGKQRILARLVAIERLLGIIA